MVKSTLLNTQQKQVHIIKKNSSQSEKSVFTWTDNNLDYRGVLAGAVMTAVKSLEQLQPLQIF